MVLHAAQQRQPSCATSAHAPNTCKPERTRSTPIALCALALTQQTSIPSCGCPRGLVLRTTRAPAATPTIQQVVEKQADRKATARARQQIHSCNASTYTLPAAPSTQHVLHDCGRCWGVQCTLKLNPRVQRLPPHNMRGADQSSMHVCIQDEHHTGCAPGFNLRWASGFNLQHSVW